MNSLFTSFTLKSMLRRRKVLRIRLFLCIFTIFPIYLITGIYSFLEANAYADLKKVYGNWNFAVYKTSSNTNTLLHQNVLIDEIGTMSIYGTIRMDSSNDSYNDYYIGSLDDTTMNLTGLTFECGRAPKNSSEIALEKNLLLKLGIDNDIGSTITLTYVNMIGEAKRINYTLCGIVNSYHNTYLKQGPLVTAFVHNSYNSNFNYTQYTNTFVKLKRNYRSQTIMNEIKDGILDADTYPSEKWYYNSYIEKPSDMPFRPLYFMLITSLFLTVGLYHSFLFYFKERHNILINSQLMGINRKMILRIHLQESFFYIMTSYLSCFILTRIIRLIIYGILKVLPTHSKLAINYQLLTYCLIITLVSLVLGILGPCLMCSFATDKMPKQSLPTPAVSINPRKYKRNTFIVFRLVHVYKEKVLYFFISNLCTILLLSILGISCNYLYKNIRHIQTEHIIDYTIGLSPFSSADQGKSEQISPLLMNNLAKVDEIKDIIKYRYTKTDSLLLLQVPEYESYYYNSSTQARSMVNLSRLVPKLEDSSTDSCILYLPKQNHVSTSEPSINEDSRVGDVIQFNYLDKYYALKVIYIMDENEFKAMTNQEACNIPCVFLNSKTYNEITLSSDNADYNYASIVYNTDVDYSITTNIIDSILFSTSDITMNHLNKENKNTITLLTRKLNLYLLFTVLVILLSIVLQDSQRSIVEKYLQYHIHVFWYLGLSKKEIVRLYLKFYYYLIFLSLLGAFILTWIYYCVFFTPTLSILPFTHDLLLAHPRYFYFCGLYICCYLVFYLFRVYKYIYKIINSF